MEGLTIAYLVCGIVLCLHIFFWFLVQRPPKNIDLKRARVLITGGSSGIGYAVARMMLKTYEAEHVVICARNAKKLADAARRLREETQREASAVSILALDVSDPEAAATIEAVAQETGGFDVCVMSAGVSQPGRFTDVQLDAFEYNMRVNLLGSVHTARGVVPLMQQRGQGRLVFVSSLAGLAGVAGLSCYNASKFAVRGLAETVCMEMKPFGIGVSLVNPPDVDTPMLEREMADKPLECKILSADSGLFQPEQVAQDVLDAITGYRFMVNTGFDGKLLGILSATITTPATSVWQVWIEFLSSSILRVVGLVYLKMWNNTVASVYKQENLIGSKSNKDE